MNLASPAVLSSKARFERLEFGLFYAAMAGVSMGIALQQIMLGLFALVQLLVALFFGLRLGTLFMPGRRVAVVFMLVLQLCAVVASQSLPTETNTRIHWGLAAFWVVSPAVFARIDWVKSYRIMLWLSVPALFYSIYWLLRPAEIAWAMGEGGFNHYPRAAGFVNNPITYAESLVVLAGWTLARLHYAPPSPRERKWMYVHLAVSILIVVFSRVRSGVLGFVALFLLNALLTPRFRKWGLAVCAAIPLLFALLTQLFGFNLASIEERVDLAQQSIELFVEHPVFGIGPNKFEKEVPGYGKLPKHPHNTLLGMATEFGVVGLLGYLAFIISLALQLRKLLLRHRDADDGLTWVVHALLFGFVSFNLFGMFDYNFGDTELLIMHALSWGLIAHLAQRGRSPSPTTIRLKE